MIVETFLVIVSLACLIGATYLNLFVEPKRAKRKLAKLKEHADRMALAIEENNLGTPLARLTVLRNAAEAYREYEDSNV